MTSLSNDLLFKLYGDGLNDYEVAIRLHVGRNRLRAWRQEYGVPSKTNKKGLVASDYLTIKQALLQGETLTGLGRILGVHRSSVAKFLHKNGVSWRTYRPKHPTWASDYRLTDPQREMLYGDLFGDGHLASTSTSSAYYTCTHSIEQVPFVEWKHNMLQPLSSRIRQGKTWQMVRGAFYPYVTMGTWTNGELGALRALFYPDGQKHLRPDLVELLTPLSLATWYMGDGSRNRYTGVFHAGLAVDMEPIARTLSKRFEMIFKAVRYEKEWHLRVMEPEKFFNLVRPHIIPCFLYKIPSKYVAQNSSEIP